MSDRLTTFDEVLAALDGDLPRESRPLTAAQHLMHCAGSIEFAVRGYPKLKPAIVRGTIGKLAKRMFLARGDMHHDTSEPTLGTETADPATPLEQAVSRLRNAIAAFRAHSGPFMPHLIYGACTKAEYERLQSAHVADHLRAIRAS